VTTQATLTPPGLITGKATGCGLIAGMANQATTQANLNPPSLITGKATGPSKEASPASLMTPAAVFWSTIWRQTMVKQKAHKAAAAAARAKKDRQFTLFQQELGLSSEDDGRSWLQAPP
jgi:hypothetical protein